jgi:DMSO/TMAO reductase YedYZ molybdopterin-dependent catalytic subunit
MNGSGQAARTTGLVVRRAEIINREIGLSQLTGEPVVPNERFYVRDHHPEPELDINVWRLHVSGLVQKPLSLSLQELLEMPARSMVATLECAGNGRALLSPPVDGEQWGLGAVSAAEWTGVSLAELLDQAGVRNSARNIVFRGADLDDARRIRFERSLALEDLREPGVLLAYAMNGQPLPRQHGYPLRAIVPGWYAVASVKWLTDLELISHSFSGYYQTHKYVYEWNRNGHLVSEPVRHQRVRAVICFPQTGDTVEGRELDVRGLAWSGSAPIARVDVSLNGGAWQQARLVGKAPRYGWQPWQFVMPIAGEGEVRICARAMDAVGHLQPERAVWNRLGYGNNAVQEVVVHAI